MIDKDLENIIYSWINLKYELYNILEHDNCIYLYYENEEYADIRIDKKTEYIYYKSDFRDEFLGVFYVELSDFKRILTTWVENIFNLKGFSPHIVVESLYRQLKIPK